MAAKKRRPGRPRTLKKGVTVGIHIEQADLRVLREMAEEYGQSLSALLRDILQDTVRMQKEIRASEAARRKQEP